MPLLSPGVLVKEKDFSTIVPIVASAIGGIAGDFTEGPLETPILISSESNLMEIFGRPNDTNAGVWFTAAQFLGYANKLWVSRATPAGCKNPTTSGTAALIKNYEDYDTKWSAGTLSTAGEFIGKNPGTASNGLAIYLVDHGNYTAFVADSTLVDYSGKHYSTWLPAQPDTSAYVAERAFNITAGSDKTKYDELSIIIVDATGQTSGRANTVVEVFNYMSKASDAVDYQNVSTYYKDVLNTQSNYIYWNKTTTTSIQSADNISIFDWGKTAYEVADGTDKYAVLTAVVKFSLSGGVAGTTPATADITSAYDQFKHVEEIDVNLLMTANHPVEVVKYVVELAAARKDCVAFVSPHNSGKPYTTRSTMTTDVIAYKASLNIADQYQSYGVMDSGFKYIYDTYNRKYRWVALNGDVAGITARVDDLADPWWSPGGFNRGGVRNIVKLSWNPSQSERDIIYPKGINPVVTFSGSGTILFGDRTMQEKPSAFDRINVRRLFIVLEKAISVAAKYQLFEFNDSFTRAQFRNMVEPFLRDIQGRRGITDFKVICDESNNTGEVVDRNEFVADIYIKPARSINYVYLNFVATKTGVDFSTVIGG